MKEPKDLTSLIELIDNDMRILNEKIELCRKDSSAYLAYSLSYSYLDKYKLGLKVVMIKNKYV